VVPHLCGFALWAQLTRLLESVHGFMWPIQAQESRSGPYVTLKIMLVLFYGLPDPHLELLYHLPLEGAVTVLTTSLCLYFGIRTATDGQNNSFQSSRSGLSNVIDTQSHDMYLRPCSFKRLGWKPLCMPNSSWKPLPATDMFFLPHLLSLHHCHSSCFSVVYPQMPLLSKSQNLLQHSPFDSWPQDCPGSLTP
jgi:hypothetical protein